MEARGEEFVYFTRGSKEPLEPSGAAIAPPKDRYAPFIYSMRCF